MHSPWHYAQATLAEILSSASFSVTFLLLFGAEFWHKIFRCERISQKQSKKSQKCRVNSVLILYKFLNSAQILYKFLNSQIQEFFIRQDFMTEFLAISWLFPSQFRALEFWGAKFRTKKWQKSVEKTAQNDRISASVARPLGSFNVSRVPGKIQEISKCGTYVHFDDWSSTFHRFVTLPEFVG